MFYSYTVFNLVIEFHYFSAPSGLSKKYTTQERKRIGRNILSGREELHKLLDIFTNIKIAIVWNDALKVYSKYQGATTCYF